MFLGFLPMILLIISFTRGRVALPLVIYSLPWLWVLIIAWFWPEARGTEDVVLVGKGVRVASWAGLAYTALMPAAPSRGY